LNRSLLNRKAQKKQLEQRQKKRHILMDLWTEPLVGDTLENGAVLAHSRSLPGTEPRVGVCPEASEMK
jgi:hypothetical protein